MKYELDLQNLITFKYVANLKSFASTAKILKVSRSIITNRISQLENSLGLALFHRTTREVNLTSEGRNFLQYCTDVINKVEKLDEFINYQKSVKGELRIVLPPYFSRYHIVPYLTEFLAKYPDLNLNISLTENPVNIIAEGYDLQVRIQVPEEEDLEVVKLKSNGKIICASKEYVEKYGAPQTPRDLLEHNCIIFGENEVWNLKNKITGEIVSLKDMKGNIVCDNGEIIKELVLSGAGITLKSNCDVHNEIDRGEIVLLLQDWEIINNTRFYIVIPANKFKNAKVNAFIEFFQGKLEA